MLLTVLEILVFMIIAAILGVLLGWVLRGALGREQADVSDLRAQLRNLKKQQRENDAATKAERVSSSTTTTTSSAAKLTQSKPAETKKTSPANKATVTKKTAVEDATAKKTVVAEKTAVKKSPAKKTAKAKKVTVKRNPPKPDVVKTRAAKPVAQMSKAEKSAKQRAAKKDVAAIVSRIGKGETKDDLTKIFGIGPKFSSMLNKMGIRSYTQISKLRKADIRTISSAIGVFNDRIERDDWVAGAKKVIKAQK